MTMNQFQVLHLLLLATLLLSTEEYRIVQSMKKAEMIMDWYRGMIYLAECQLNEEMDDDPSAPHCKKKVA